MIKRFKIDESVWSAELELENTVEAAFFTSSDDLFISFQHPDCVFFAHDQSRAIPLPEESICELCKHLGQTPLNEGEPYCLSLSRAEGSNFVTLSFETKDAKTIRIEFQVPANSWLSKEIKLHKRHVLKKTYSLTTEHGTWLISKYITPSSLGIYAELNPSMHPPKTLPSWVIEEAGSELSTLEAL
ncbi:hypothetical protein [Neptuniibacter sp. QD37_11]|uniref:hypothetical protein n=1 Tax=Neptuniibacter sp. QD37_11 TaxID=3398209 RepID=UPI0039F6312E